MLKLVKLGNFHKPNGRLFELASDRGGRLDALHWSGSFLPLFIHIYSDFVRIGETRKTSIYDLSLV